MMSRPDETYSAKLVSCSPFEPAVKIQRARKRLLANMLWHSVCRRCKGSIASNLPGLTGVRSHCADPHTS